MEPLVDGDPSRVGRFTILARLGSGGMGRVYLAQDASGGRFALKMIHQFLSEDTQFRRRFEREVQAARRVSGPNTAALVDADPDGRPPWMAVEFVDGPTLSELIDEGGPLTAASSVRLASGMAQALIDIHAAGLVHRDLKPSNVLMGADGARLIDFGIAQASGASSLTMTGLVTGSAGFMSPEQAQAEHVTEASDVFALGTVLYFAATGRRPFGEGSMISVTYRVVHAEPDLGGIRDEGLRDLIANCLLKDPQQRPTPREILARCPGILDGSWQAAAGAAARARGGNTDTLPALALALAPEHTQPQVRVAAPVLPARPAGPGHTNPGHSGGVAGGAPGRRRSKFWVLLVSGAVVVVVAGAAVAASLLGDRSAGSDTPGSATVTEAPAVPAQTTEVTQPGGAVPTLPGASPTRTYRAPTRPSATATSTATPTRTKKPTPTPTRTPTRKPTPTATEPDPDPTPTADPDPTPTTDPDPTATGADNTNP